MSQKNNSEKRCWPIEADDELMKEYHDTEWGRPSYDDRYLFELLILEGAQAGLSWKTILNKRKNYKKAFANFEVKKIAKFDEGKIQALMQDAGIVRNLLKIKSVIRNAKVFMEIQKEFGTFSAYIWVFTNGEVIKRKQGEDIPVSTELSDKISKDLKKRGMNFVGSTIIYAYLQAIGVVNDHLADCVVREPSSTVSK